MLTAMVQGLLVLDGTLQALSNLLWLDLVS